MMEDRYIRRDGPVHKYCGLDYINFFTLPRTVLMDMPTEWQEKFVALLEDLDEKTDYRGFLGEKDTCFMVTAQKGNKFCSIPEELSNYRHPQKCGGQRRNDE